MTQSAVNFEPGSQSGNNAFRPSAIDAIVLAVTAIMIRLPELLSRGAPASDEAGYMAACFKLFGVDAFQGRLNIVDYDKVFFFLVVSPFVNFLYWLTGSFQLTASIVAFSLSILFVLLFYYVTSRIYGRSAGWWAGLLSAVLPAMIIGSSKLLTHQFYVFFFILATFMMWSYLQKGKSSYLIISCILFVSIARVRFEGILVYFAFMTVFWWTMRVRQVSLKSQLRQLAMLAGCALVMLIIYRLVSETLYGSLSKGGYGRLFSISLGYLSNKLRVLFNTPTPGGLLEADKFEYALKHLDVIGLAVLAVLYDLLKTIFIIPGRLIPPLLFPLLGFSILGFPGREARSMPQKAVDAVCLLSLLSILVYPVFWFSASRFAFLLVPVMILFIARGLAAAEENLRYWFSSIKNRVWAKTLLATPVLIYLMFINIQVYVPVVRATEQTDYLREPVEWINSRFSDQDISVVGLGDWIARLDLRYIRIPMKTEHQDGYWKAVPVSFGETLQMMRDEGEALLVLIHGQVIQTQQTASFNHSAMYFSESAKRILPFTDESLENMEWFRTQSKKFLFQEFQPLLRGEVEIPGLELAGTIGSGYNMVYVYHFKTP